MRLGGDAVRDRLGAVWTVRVSAIVAAAGFVTIGMAGDPGTAVAGFALAGCGVANLVPVAFAAAGNLPGVAPGMALAIASFFGYFGFLIAPALVGLVAMRTGFAPVYLAASLLFAVVLALSGTRARRRPGGGRRSGLTARSCTIMHGSRRIGSVPLSGILTSERLRDIEARLERDGRVVAAELARLLRDLGGYHPGGTCGRWRRMGGVGGFTAARWRRQRRPGR